MIREAEFMRASDEWTNSLAAYVAQKGKIKPDKYRAYGFEAPTHRWSDAKLKRREIRMGNGLPPAGSSSAEQQALGLNDDVTLRPARSERNRLGD